MSEVLNIVKQHERMNRTIALWIFGGKIIEEKLPSKRWGIEYPNQNFIMDIYLNFYNASTLLMRALEKLHELNHGYMVFPIKTSQNVKRYVCVIEDFTFLTPIIGTGMGQGEDFETLVENSYDSPHEAIYYSIYYFIMRKNEHLKKVRPKNGYVCYECGSDLSSDGTHYEICNQKQS